MRLAMLAVMLAAAPVLAAPMAPVEADTAKPVDASPPAPAEADKAKPIAAAAPAPAHGLDHTGQIGISLRLAIGMRAIAPYDKAVYCGKTDSTVDTGNAPVCVDRSPFVLDLEGSYGLRARLDAFLELRLGIEADFGSTVQAMDGPHIVHVSPGVRFYFSEARRSKLFSTAQLVLDFSSYKDPTTNLARSSDFGVRNLNGIWFEIDRSYGVYAFAGETLTFVRWLAFDLEAGLGFQARY